MMQEPEVLIQRQTETATGPALTSRVRLSSLDQFRGFTMLGMLIVNFLGSYDVCPRLLQHTHDYCSFADLIMPQFLFAAGFSLRLTLVARRDRDGRVPWGRLMRRIVSLAAIAVIWYSVTDAANLMARLRTQPLPDVLAACGKRQWFQTLMQIAATTLWITPVVLCRPRTRLLFALASASLHVALSSWFLFDWVHAAPRSIDGGPLGFLSWSLPAIAGTWACDLVRNCAADQRSSQLLRLLVTGCLACGAGWLLSQPTVLYSVAASSRPQPPLATDAVIPHPRRIAAWSGEFAEPPFVPPPPSEQRQGNYWMMTQRACSISYTLFSAGVSCLVFSGFRIACDFYRWQSALLRTLGTNSLAAYILHDILGWGISPFLSHDADLPSVSAGLALFIATTAGACRWLEIRGWYLRV
ncbi:MAG: acyltransferase family protein [Planctomycetota bacterium]